jgi:hypothetical protein
VKPRAGTLAGLTGAAVIVVGLVTVAMVVVVLALVMLGRH